MNPTHVTLSDGRKASIREFQAHEFVTAAQSFSQTSVVRSTAAMIASFCCWEDRAITTGDVMDMGEEDFARLGDLLQFTATHAHDGGYILPQSGKVVTVKRATVSDLMSIEEMPAEHRPYARIHRLAKFDGEVMDPHDIKIMPGGDYIALMGLVSQNPT